MLELDAAIANHVPIITIGVHNSFSSDASGIGAILDDLPGYLQNPGALTAGVERVGSCEKVLYDNGIVDIAELGQQIKEAMFNPAKIDFAGDGRFGPIKDAAVEAAQSGGGVIAAAALFGGEQGGGEEPEETAEKNDAVKVVGFDPHQSSAILQGQIKQMAVALIKSACPQNATLLMDFDRVSTEPWPVNKKYAVYIVHEEKCLTAYESAVTVRDWLVVHTDLDAHQIALQEDQDNGRGRALMDVKSADLVDVSNRTDVVMLIQTKDIMSQPRS
eukprot:SAG22_NODE_4157_length_1365_cov_1.327014_1_plen_273_part_10